MGDHDSGYSFRCSNPVGGSIICTRVNTGIYATGRDRGHDGTVTGGCGVGWRFSFFEDGGTPVSLGRVNTFCNAIFADGAVYHLLLLLLLRNLTSTFLSRNS